MLYRPYSEFLTHKYGEKVYKLPINLDVTCPNRDGTVGTEGCYYCSDLGTGYESLSSQLSVKEQLLQNMAYIGNKYRAKKFIAYFQNYTNTHMPLDVFKNWMVEACLDQVVELAVSTRPDCISQAYLEVLKDIYVTKGIEITIELGLQTTNDESLVKVNRGHTVSDYVNAVTLIQKYPFEICTHLILNLPWDSDEDILETANLMNQLQMNQIKLHALYIAKNTVFEKWYLDHLIQICSKDAYIQKVILFLEHLNDNIIVQRLIGRAPKEVTTFCNWDTSWWKIKDEIEAKMIEKKTFQGKFSKDIIS
ncbi:MAG: TIGR01212 family radical SAM protein [Vallitaleaceae bacterium]|nr:TIGR01212 family radical SAM protein [Vallitaleaceae bacterium]